MHRAPPSVTVSTANFAHLAVYDLTLVRLGALAERHFHDDPSTALIKLRQFAELCAAHHPQVGPSLSGSPLPEWELALGRGR